MKTEKSEEQIIAMNTEEQSLNSESKAQEQKPDLELRKKLESELNTYRNSVYTTESSAPVLNDFNWFFNKYSALQSENQRLTEEVKKLKIELSNYVYQIDRAKRDRDKAELALEINKRSVTPKSDGNN